MKIQLYVTQAVSGANSIIRKMDGIYTMLTPYEIANPQAPYPPKDYYITAQGRTCDQDWARNTTKSALLRKDDFASNYMLYGIGRDAEIDLED